MAIAKSKCSKSNYVLFAGTHMSIHHLYAVKNILLPLEMNFN